MQDPESGPLVSRADKTVTVREAAVLMNVTEERILRWIADKRLPAAKRGRRWSIASTALALMPKDSLKAAVDEILHPSAVWPTTTTHWWKAATAAALRVHAGEFIGGCRCEFCQVLRQPPMDGS